MKIIEVHIVPDTLTNNPRLYDYVIGIFDSIQTRKGIKKAIQRGLILINNERGHSGDYIHKNDVLSLIENSIIKPEYRLSLPILYEDNDIAIINKPSGIEVSGNKLATIENALSCNLKPSTSIDSLRYPLPCHRIDFPTSGILVIAKTRSALVTLKQMFEYKEIKKEYTAIAIGLLPSNSGHIDSPIEGKNSISQYDVIQTVKSEKYGYLSLLKLNPITGRKHQLRRHLHEINCPILGDRDYNINNLNSSKGLYLHASKIVFNHPCQKKEINISSTPTRKFLKIFPLLKEL